MKQPERGVDDSAAHRDAANLVPSRVETFEQTQLRVSA
jgi:hypothetical protein